MILYSRLDGLMLYGKLGIDFFTTSEILYPNLKVRIRIIRAGPYSYMVSGRPNVSLGIVDCSLYTQRVLLKEDYHKERMFQIAYAPIVYNYKEILTKTYITEPIYSGKYIQQRIYTSNCHCNEFKLCFYLLLCREPIRVSTVYSERF